MTQLEFKTQVCLALQSTADSHQGPAHSEHQGTTLQSPGFLTPCGQSISGESAAAFRGNHPSTVGLTSWVRPRETSRSPPGLNSLASGCPAGDTPFKTSGSHSNPVEFWPLQTEQNALKPYHCMTLYMPSTQELHTNTVIESVSPTDNIISFSGEGTRYREEEEWDRNHCEHMGYRNSRLGFDHKN